MEYPPVVKIIVDDDRVRVKNPKWHYVTSYDADRTLCCGEAFGLGESRCVYQRKRGKITCPDCIRIIKELKAVKL